MTDGDGYLKAKAIVALFLVFFAIFPTYQCVRSWLGYPILIGRYDLVFGEQARVAGWQNFRWAAGFLFVAFLLVLKCLLEDD